MKPQVRVIMDDKGKVTKVVVIEDDGSDGKELLASEARMDWSAAVPYATLKLTLVANAAEVVTR